MDERTISHLRQAAHFVENGTLSTRWPKGGSPWIEVAGTLRALADDPYPKWIEEAKRAGDMDPDVSVRLLREEEGDVILEVVETSRNINTREVFSVERKAIQFCTGGGGGRSLRTHRALCELMLAIEQDNAERPL